ncbi:Sperm-associated antigen 17 [Acipenser ruthenus]|uniref:Sperm-associated antigen 17 n=1 Tax=Acipenser ruthenus TaxID=7906 RepID=A0A444U8S4_ACIRT|nr:Sperm-associated antigen 17 [Acipenser ruthenus]
MDCWKVNVSSVVGENLEDEIYIKALLLPVQQPLRKLFSVVSWDGMLKKVAEQLAKGKTAAPSVKDKSQTKPSGKGNKGKKGPEPAAVKKVTKLKLRGEEEDTSKCIVLEVQKLMKEKEAKSLKMFWKYLVPMLKNNKFYSQLSETARLHYVVKESVLPQEWNNNAMMDCFDPVKAEPQMLRLLPVAKFLTVPQLKTAEN